ncbi:MAG: hypothetical protein ISS29_07750 [Candidatus Marinimicrobia bacterium]|nr:hypothetical protein [Candidatus Neomarinimicrobiota bacterium]
MFIAQKKSSGFINVLLYNNQSFDFSHYVNQSRFKQNNNYIFDVNIDEEKLTILNKIKHQSLPLKSYVEITRGVNPYDIYTGQKKEIIKNRIYHSDYKKNETFVPELKGKHVSYLNYQWDEKHYISYGDWLAAPRNPKYFKGPRLIFREIIADRFICTFIEEDFIIDRSLYIALPIKDVDLKYILGILSSNLLSWFFRYSLNEFDLLFPKIRLAEFKELPIINSPELHDKLIKKVNQILAAKKADPQADTSPLEAGIDRMVYELYGLTEAEIAIVEQG